MATQPDCVFLQVAHPVALVLGLSVHRSISSLFHHLTLLFRHKL